MSSFDEQRTITLRVNGVERTATTPVRTHLADFLRNSLGLTGTHLGCEQGACGACTVLVDDRAIRSCLMFAVQADGREVLTIEGVAEGDDLHPLQESFSRHHGLQCGFCTPGMVLAALDLLRRDPEPTEETIREELSGNLCRCTGYEGIVDAVLDAARRLARTGDEEPAMLT